MLGAGVQSLRVSRSVKPSTRKAVSETLRPPLGHATQSVDWAHRAVFLAPLAVFVGGIGYALYLKSNDRAKYETIGRMVHEGL